MPPPAITYYVVLLPLAGSLPPLRPIARLVQDEEANIAKKLETQTYEVLGRFARSANAQGLVQQLWAFGVNCLMVSDQEIRGHLIVSMSTANRGAGGMALRDFDDKPLYCPFEDIAGVCLLPVYSENGDQTLLIDLLRRSTNITPRLDASLFDFGHLMGRDGADIEDFLLELEQRSAVSIDRKFGENYSHLVTLTTNFASRPAAFSPPTTRLASPYDSNAHAAANLYSLIQCLALKNVKE